MEDDPSLKHLHHTVKKNYCKWRSCAGNLKIPLGKILNKIKLVDVENGPCVWLLDHDVLSHQIIIPHTLMFKEHFTLVVGWDGAIFIESKLKPSH